MLAVGYWNERVELLESLNLVPFGTRERAMAVRDVKFLTPRA